MKNINKQWIFILLSACLLGACNNEDFLESTSVGTKKEVLMDYGPLSDTTTRYVLEGSAWNKTNLTYYFVNAPSSLSAFLAYEAVEHAFSTWDKFSKLTFTRVYSLSSADIKVAWYSGNHGDGTDNAFDGRGGILAHAYYPAPSGGRYAGQLHFDDDELWTIGNLGSDMESVALHEIGHLLGIKHSEDNNAVMYPYYSDVKRNLTQDDVEAVWRLYSCPFAIGCSSASQEFGNFYVTGLPSTCSVNWTVTCQYGDNDFQYSDSRTYTTANFSLSNWHSAFRLQQYLLSANVVDTSSLTTVALTKFVNVYSPSLVYGQLYCITSGGSEAYCGREASGSISLIDGGDECVFTYSENSGPLVYSLQDPNFSFEVNGRSTNAGGGMELYKSDIIDGHIPVDVYYNSHKVTFMVPVDSSCY